MGDKDIWKILAISVAFVIVASSVAIFSAANLDIGISEKGIDEGGGKGVISLEMPSFIGVAGASGSYAAAANLDTGESFSSIQAAIDDLDTKGGHTITVNPGYHIENVNVRKSLTIKSVGGNPSDTVIKAADSSNTVISITTNNVSIIGIQTEGSTMDTDTGTGMYLSNVSYCYIANCSVTMNGIGIFVVSSSDNILYNNSVSANLGMGIALFSSNNNTIDHNIVLDNGFSGIYLLDSENNLILNNTCCDNKVSGIYFDGSDGNKATENNVTRNTDDGIELVESEQNVIENNLAGSNGNDGIGLWDSERNVISNNIALSNSYSGIHLNNSKGSTITGNNASYNERAGIGLESSEENVIENNLVLNNCHDGITLLLSERNVVLNNLALNNGRNGINIYIANDNKIIGNNASYNKGVGILVYSSTSEIRRNVANSNFYKGIETYNSDESVIEENICENNIEAKPDLVIKRVFGTGWYPRNVPVNIRIENRGVKNAEPPFTVEVKAEYKRQLDVWYETKRVDVRNVLSPGKYVDVCITLKKHGADWDGIVPITVHVDRWNSVVESNEGNNIYHGTAYIHRA